MGIFVCVQHFLSHLSNEPPRSRFIGELLPSALSPVTDYFLRDLKSQRTVSTIHAYPRWTESGLTTFVRLLDASEDVLCERFSGRLRATLHIGGASPTVLEGECLQVDQGISAMHVLLLSPAAVAMLSLPAPGELTMRNAICTAFSTALGWETRIDAPPLPLSRVRIRRGTDERLFVRLVDVPPLTRLYLRKAFRLSEVATEISADQWRAFMSVLGTE